jgi:hypothetical protein
VTPASTDVIRTSSPHWFTRCAAFGSSAAVLAERRGPERSAPPTLSRPRPPGALDLTVEFQPCTVSLYLPEATAPSRPLCRRAASSIRPNVTPRVSICSGQPRRGRTAWQRCADPDSRTATPSSGSRGRPKVSPFYLTYVGRGMPISPLERSKVLATTIKEIESATDRVAGIVGSALIEDRLTTMLHDRFRQDEPLLKRLFSHTGPLAAFGTKSIWPIL